jgi:hypothetical protein
MNPLFHFAADYNAAALDVPHLLGGFGKFFVSLFMIPPDLFFSDTF